MSIIGGTTVPKTWTGTYTFAVNGGASAALSSNDGAIPAGSYITGGFVDVTVVPTSAASTATIALTVEGANDVVTATIISSEPWATTGRKDIIPDGTGSTALKLTADRTPSFVIATQATTAGTFKLVLEYI